MMNNEKKSLNKFFNSRSLKYGSNSMILIAAVIAIAVLVNVLVSPDFLKKMTGKSSLKLDLTPEKLYSIGDTTKKILSGLQKDVKVYGLFDEEKIKSDAELKEAVDLLEKYAGAHVKIEYVDVDKKPDFITSLDKDNLKKLQKDDFVFVCGNKIKKVSVYDLFQTEFDQQSFQQYKTGSKAEQEFTGAIKYVTSDVTPVVYFTEGHDELKTDAELAIVKQYAEKNNYEVKTINLLSAEKVPEDATTLVVVSPKKDLMAAEKDKIVDYLKNGGNAMFFFDSDKSGTSFANFEAVLNTMNVGLNYDVVKENDQTRSLQNRPNDLIVSLESNDVNGDLSSEDFAMIFPSARSVNILKNQKEYITVTSLAKTSDQAVGEMVDTSKGSNINGPLDLAVAVENKGGANPSKVIVAGNGVFLTDNVLQQVPTGLTFFLNSLGWMQDIKDDVVIAPKNYVNSRLEINALQANVTIILLVILLPLIVLGTGTFVWMRRRHL